MRQPASERGVECGPATRRELAGGGRGSRCDSLLGHSQIENVYVIITAAQVFGHPPVFINFSTNPPCAVLRSLNSDRLPFNLQTSPSPAPSLPLHLSPAPASAFAAHSLRIHPSCRNLRFLLQAHHLARPVYSPQRPCIILPGPGIHHRVCVPTIRPLFVAYNPLLGHIVSTNCRASIQQLVLHEKPLPSFATRNS